jgi:predicted enzyme related to lactoylglutathione lyase
MSRPILELRVALTADDYERVVHFYEIALGVEPSQLWTTKTTRARLYELGRGTLEIFDPAHAATVDEIETGARTSGQIRFALEVPDLDAALERALAAGATLVHEPVVTPWNDRNARLQSPDGLQITLFQPQGAD